MMLCSLRFFFFKQKTAYEMRISDWSSDVCSSDLLIDWVLRAYESSEILPYPALLVLGPFMQRERRAEFLGRVARLPRVEAITFDAHMEHLVQNAVGVIAMGGYNTFCEILSLNKRAEIGRAHV